MKWFLAAFKKYAQFSGRARRKEFWLFNMVVALISILFFVGLLTYVIINPSDTEADNMFVGGVFVISNLIIALTFTVPSLAVTVRRLHDTNRSGWFILLNFIPAVGGLVLMYFMVLDSEEGINQYGPSPKESIAGFELYEE